MSSPEWLSTNSAATPTPNTPGTGSANGATASEPSANSVGVIGQLLKRLTDQISKLIKDEIELAIARAKSLGTKLGTGIGLLAVAGVFALYLLGLLLWAGSMGFSYMWAAITGGAAADLLWAGVLTVCGILLIIILILAGLGAMFLKKAQKEHPDPRPGFQKSVAAAKEGMAKNE